MFTIRIQTKLFEQYETRTHTAPTLVLAKRTVEFYAGAQGFEFAEVVKDGEVVFYHEKAGIS